MNGLVDDESTIIVRLKNGSEYEELQRFLDGRGVIIGVDGVKRQSDYSRTLMALIWRDGTNCWLCDNPMDFTTRATEYPFAPSFDHVIPHSLGGTKHLENLKLAHRVCNKARGANPDWISPLRGTLTPEKIQEIMGPWLKLKTRKKRTCRN